MHKLLNFKIVSLLLIVFSTASCLTTTTDTEISTDPYFYSLKFAANDSIPNIEDAAFTLEYDAVLGDSIIVNVDSLPYQTRIDSVNPTFSFHSSSSISLLMNEEDGSGLDTVFITGKDTIDFSRVISVTNYAEDGKTHKTYPVKVNVHTVEGEFYLWQKVKDAVYPYTASQQKALLFNNTCFYYLGTGVRNILYISQNYKDWTETPLSGLPVGMDLRNIQVYGSKMYISQLSVGTYESTDGKNWTKSTLLPSGFEIVNFLFVLNNNLWSIVKPTNSNDYHFANSADGKNWTINGLVPSNFPIGDFAAVSFTSRTKKPKAIVLGGYDKNGVILRTSWTTEDGAYWVDFSIENATLKYNAGASIIVYDDKLLMLGGMDANDNVLKKYYQISVDEGFTWTTPDTSYNVLKDTLQEIEYAPRSYQSVLYKEDTKQLVLIGGRSKSVVYSDVWFGKLTRLSFVNQ